MSNPMNRNRFVSSLVSMLACGTAATAFGQLPQQNLSLWLDAADAGTIATEGGQVTQWSDKSGSGFHATQADVARQPVVVPNAINGQPALRFDATGAGDPNSDGLQIDTGLNLQRPYSVFIVDQYWGDVRGRTLQGQGTNWLLGKWGGNTAHFTGAWAGPGGGIPAANVNAAVSEGWGSLFDSKFGVNGRFVGGNTAPGAPGTLQLGVVGPAGNPPFDEPSQADVAEVIAYNRLLTDSERNQVSSYLSNKFGIAGFERHNGTRTVAFSGGDPGEGLDFQGNFTYAVNARGDGGFSIGDAAFTNDAGVISSENEILNWFPANFGGSANDTNLNSVMQSIRWTAVGDGGQEDLTASMSGLTVGNTYKLQMLFADTGVARHWGVSVNGSVQVANFNGAAHTGTADNLGVALVHEFVATSSTLDVVFGGPSLPGGDVNPILQGFTLEDRGVTGVTSVGTFANSGDLDFVGNFVYAVDVNGAGGGTIGDAAITGDGVAGVRVSAENNIPVGGWGAPNYGDTPGDDALETMISSIRWSTGEISLDLDVVPGAPYKLQLLFGEACCDRGFDVSIEDVLVADNFSPFALGGTAANNMGAFVSHEFVAGDDTLNVVLSGLDGSGGHPDPNPILNGFTLELIPEPGTGILAFGGLAILALRRRRTFAIIAD